MLQRGPLLRSILPGVVQVPLRGTSAFLLLDRRITLIDTGLPGSGRRVLAAVALARRSVDEIERIIITHYHPDHIGGLAELQRLLPARTGIHAVEAPVVTGRHGPPSPFVAPLVRAAYRPLHGRVLPHRPVRIDDWLHDGDELPVLGGMQVLHTPGHTPGHICLYFPRMALLVAGDAMEYRGRRLSGPAPAFTEDMPEALRSLERLAGLDLDVIAFSHFPRIPVHAGERLCEVTATIGNRERGRR